MKLSKRFFYIIVVIVLTIAVDQISKVIVRKYIDSNEVIRVIGDYFTLHNVENTGAFLGMGSDLNPVLRMVFLLILPIVVLVLVLRHILKDKNLDYWSLFAFSSIIGGGIANVFDRIVYGKVTDFFYINLTDFIHTGVFNMADLSVTTGMIILVITSFRNKKKPEIESLFK